MPRPQRAETDQAEAERLTEFLAPRMIRSGLPKTPQVYDVIRQAIVSLAFPPGAPINEKLICERLEISRTPVREALIQLHAENLVHVVPNSGTFVSPIDLQRLFDGQLVRDALETRVVQFAARKATPGFVRTLDFNMHQQRVLAAEADYNQFYELDEGMHRAICEFGASSEVWKIVYSAKAHLDRVRRLAYPEPDHLRIVLGEHEEILEALRAQDPDAARQAMQAHLDRVFLTIRHLMGQRPDYFAPDAGTVFAEFASLYEREAWR
ncbi:MAG: GntR family transcriptional regulator [Rubellimicrobium sp.]|nr:GntR family transcriptional regulator [Rubellimicrobium sp.]